MTLPPLKLVLTAAGCPGASTLIRMLKANGEREIAHPRRRHAPGRRRALPVRRLQPRAGRRLARVHPGARRGRRARAPRPALRPVVARDRDGGAPPRRVRGARRARARRRRARHRDRQRQGRHARRLQRDPGAAAASCSGRRASTSSSPAPAQLGYPDVPGVLQAAGRQGLARLPHPLRARSTASTTCSTRSPINRYMTLRRLRRPVHAATSRSRELMLMEYVDAPEITVDLFADKGEVVFHQTRTREEFLTGLAMAFKTIDRPGARGAHAQGRPPPRPGLLPERAVDRRQAAGDQPARQHVRVPGGLHHPVPRASSTRSAS